MVEIELVKTDLLGIWQIVNVGNDGLISTHIKDLTDEQIYAIMIDGLKNQIVKMPEGFKINIDDYVVYVKISNKTLSPKTQSLDE